MQYTQPLRLLAFNMLDKFVMVDTGGTWHTSVSMWAVVFVIGSLMIS